MEGLLNFLDDLLRGFLLLLFALAFGAQWWSASVLPQLGGSERLRRLARRTVAFSAALLAMAHLLAFLIKGFALDAALSRFSWSLFLTTTWAQATLLRGALAAIWSFLAFGRPGERALWLAAIGVWLSGGWLTHAVGRLENGLLLMAATLIHQAAACSWLGGIWQLLLIWWWDRPRWQRALVAFFEPGFLAVVVAVTSGALLAHFYVGSLPGLVGSGYGTMVVVKTALLAAVLACALFNHHFGQRREAFSLVPPVVETELFLLAALLFVAAALSGLPPAIDIEPLLVPVQEVWAMFAPKWPQLSSPSIEELLPAEEMRKRLVEKVPEETVAAVAWSNFNHNIAGLFVVVMALFALVGYFKRFSWSRYWPVGFFGLGLFILLRSDAEAWPFGPMGFFESMFANGEILQHRLGALLAFLLGGIEIRARRPGARRFRYLFPLLAAFGGIVLLTHSHVGFELQTEFLIQSTHVAMGLFALFLGACRWLEIRLPPPYSCWAGAIAMGWMVGVGLLLLFYKEPLG